MKTTAMSAASTPRRLETTRHWWRNPSITVPLLVFAVARVVTLFIGVMALRSGPVNNVWSSSPIYVESLQARQFSNPLTPLIEPWHRWDTGWYLKIAAQGYSADDGSIIFQPLYPVLMVVVGVVAGDKLLAGLIISGVSCIIFLSCFYRLIKLDFHSDSLAANALILLVAFPTAFYFQAAYTESLFLALVAGALLAARHHRWWIVTVLAMLATLTRIQGWILFFPVGWLAFIETPRFWQAQGVSWVQRIRQAIPRLFAIGIGPLMVIVVQGYLLLAGLGSVPAAFANFWAMDVKPPWSPVIDVVARMINGTASATEYAGFFALLLIVCLLVLSIRRLPTFYHLYLWPTLVLILLRYYRPTLLNGTMRYVLDFFPVFIALGLVLANRRWLRMLYIVVGITLQLLLVYLFVRWAWIS